MIYGYFYFFERWMCVRDLFETSTRSRFSLLTLPSSGALSSHIFAISNLNNSISCQSRSTAECARLTFSHKQTANSAEIKSTFNTRLVRSTRSFHHRNRDCLPFVSAARLSTHHCHILIYRSQFSLLSSPLFFMTSAEAVRCRWLWLDSRSMSF